MWSRIAAALLLASASSIHARSVETHDLRLVNPVHPDVPAQTYELELTFDGNGFPLEYQMFLRTDVCLDRECQMLEAWLIWDAMGSYLRTEYEAERPLTKGDHKPFTQADYRRLDIILKDRESALGRHSYEYFLVRPSLPNNVDGVSAATPVELQRSVVKGAAYSTWALWHWVNGEIQEQIGRITRSHSSDAYLLHCLQSDDESFVQYALRELSGRPAVDPVFTVPFIAILESGSERSCRLALDNLALIDSDEIPFLLAQTVGVNQASSRLILEYLRQVTDADLRAWESLAQQLDLLGEYQEIAITLELLSRHAGSSEAVRRHVERLLERGEPLITYRARRFLQ